MNFFIYMRPPIKDIDDWEALGNPGWNWETHLKYTKRAEKFTPPTAAQTETFHQTYDPEVVGTEGNLQVAFPSLIMDGEVPFQQTVKNTGIKILDGAALSGDVNGAWMAAATIDPVKKTRSIKAFYLPYRDRSNLKVMVEAHVNKVLFASERPNNLLIAEGVEFTVAGTKHVVHAKKEMILSAGQSPQILELSGIGDPSILTPLGIECLNLLPGVGNNVQEYVFYPTSFELNDKENGWNTLDKLRNPESAKAEMALFNEKRQQGLYTMSLANVVFTPLQQASPIANDLITALSVKLEQARKDGHISDALWEQYQMQLSLVKSDKAIDLELVTLPYYCTTTTPPEEGKAYMTILAALNSPFSRGSIHVASSDPEQPPLCDPHYFENDFDMQVLGEGLKFIRRLQDVEPFKSMIVKQIDPSPKLQTDGELRNHIISELNTTFRAQ
ncbi:FAD-linked reductases C-terminal domain-containing protein [Dacryopinax primogenitus]|uniref:FAD-linked reductases C-terminal domain-containing protein n=1 Tax=Dacryopinax primogenitus (strain DJM 731) TaxID=1858805 RepID=M5FN52_DACPD|nr:FAD-linked reductases C-terminal domain-containing protein [Dacryopinax primogenitus]EJT96840.1 FAD-linked reductases C-terminal domain-containing protein [Dacryopinax primogenitus]